MFCEQLVQILLQLAGISSFPLRLLTAPVLHVLVVQFNRCENWKENSKQMIKEFQVFTVHYYSQSLLLAD